MQRCSKYTYTYIAKGTTQKRLALTHGCAVAVSTLSFASTFHTATLPNAHMRDQVWECKYVYTVCFLSLLRAWRPFQFSLSLSFHVFSHSPSLFSILSQLSFFLLVYGMLWDASLLQSIYKSCTYYTVRFYILNGVYLLKMQCIARSCFACDLLCMYRGLCITIRVSTWLPRVAAVI